MISRSRVAVCSVYTCMCVCMRVRGCEVTHCALVSVRKEGEMNCGIWGQSCVSDDTDMPHLAAVESRWQSGTQVKDSKKKKKSL